MDHVEIIIIVFAIFIFVISSKFFDFIFDNKSRKKKEVNCYEKKKELQKIWDLFDESNDLNERVDLFNHFLYLVCKNCAETHLSKININSLNLTDYISLYNKSSNFSFVTYSFPLEYRVINGTAYLLNSTLNKAIIQKSKYTNDFCKVEYSCYIIDEPDATFNHTNALSLTIKLQIERDE